MNIEFCCRNQTEDNEDLSYERSQTPSSSFGCNDANKPPSTLKRYKERTCFSSLKPHAIVNTLFVASVVSLSLSFSFSRLPISDLSRKWPPSLEPACPRPLFPVHSSTDWYWDFCFAASCSLFNWLIYLDFGGNCIAEVCVHGFSSMFWLKTVRMVCKYMEKRKGKCTLGFLCASWVRTSINWTWWSWVLIRFGGFFFFIILSVMKLCGKLVLASQHSPVYYVFRFDVI